MNDRESNEIILQLIEIKDALSTIAKLLSVIFGLMIGIVFGYWYAS